MKTTRHGIICGRNHSGMATGSSGEVPAGILSGLGDFIREDPFVNSAKVDSLCAYLEKNGQAAMRFTKQQKADLKELLVKFHGSAKAERALQRLVVQYETDFFNEHLRTADGSSKRPSRSPEAVYKFLTTHEDALRAFGQDSDEEAVVYEDINAID